MYEAKELTVGRDLVVRRVFEGPRRDGERGVEMSVTSAVGVEENRRVGVITGASRGLGLALARRLAGDGWDLILTARGEKDLKRARDELSKLTSVSAIAGDISDEAHRREVVEAAAEAGGLDLLVNNASDLGVSPLPEMLSYPLDALEEVYRTNVFGPLALAQGVRGLLRDEAVVINITSDAAVEPYEGWGGYGSSKAALERISSGLAAENPRLRVYAVDPGDMRTRMHQDAFPGEDISDRPLPEESVPGLVHLIESRPPSGRYAARETGEEAGVREMRVAVTTDDFHATSAFYGEGLGLKKVEEWKGREGRGAVFEVGHATVEVLDRSQAAYVDEIETGGRTSGPVRLAFETPDAKATSEDLLEAGASAAGSVVKTPWGHYNRRLRAPGGQQVTIYEVSKSRTEAT